MQHRDLKRTPLIGKHLEVVEVKGGTYKGLKGTVIDEKMNVIKIENAGREKIIPKKVCVFAISENGKTLGYIPGEEIIGRPEKRCTQGG